MLSRLKWLELPNDIRFKIIQDFNVPRSGHAIVENQRVVSDGHTDEDLQHITIEKMQEFLKTKEDDFYKLLNRVVESYSAPINAIYEETPKQDEGPVSEPTIKGTRGRPKKSDSKG